MSARLLWWLLPLAVVTTLLILSAGAPRNPQASPADHLAAHVHLTPQVRSLLTRACADCHSNETRWPWYAQIAPVSWLVANDVERARRAMNLSEWHRQTKGKTTIAASHLLAVCADVQQNRMPPASYVAMHADAQLSAADQSQLCQWTQQEAVRIRREERLRLAAPVARLTATSGGGGIQPVFGLVAPKEKTAASVKAGK